MTTRSISLIEQKKLQWSREREEMTKFYGLWGPINQFSVNEKKSSSSYLSSVLNKQRVDESDLIDCFNANRCLPPIQKSIFNEYDSKNTECNTSGYASESDSKDHLSHEKKKQWRSQSSLQSDLCSSISNVSYKDDVNNRLKWGDRGIGVGYLWEPTTDFEARLPDINNRPGTPHWLQRSLVEKNHLRGQSVLIEPSEMHEREKKRQKALELQEGIRQQLQEREKKRKADKDLQLEEERKLEQRIKEQHQLEKNRMEEETKKQKEKEEKEDKKTKAMFEALVTAEKQAKEAKSKINKSKSCDAQKCFVNGRVNLDDEVMKLDELEKAVTEEKNIISEVLKKIVTCDAQTSLTIENYFEEFKSKIPLITNRGTQTSVCQSPIRTRRKILKSNSDRPKWGVNRPNTKYMKQSEKDLFYQRKMKHRPYRRRSSQEPSGSSRSLDSTDEYKSMSSSPHEKDFNSNLKLDDLENRLKSSASSGIKKVTSKNYDSDKGCDERDRKEAMSSPKNDGNNSLSNSRDVALTQLTKLSNKLKLKKIFWENEMQKMSDDFSAITFPENNDT